MQKVLVMNCSPVQTGATAEIVHIVAEKLQGRYEVKCTCIDDYDIRFCKGCRVCHNTAKCVWQDEGLKSKNFMIKYNCNCFIA